MGVHSFICGVFVVVASYTASGDVEQWEPGLFAIKKKAEENYFDSQFVPDLHNQDCIHDVIKKSHMVQILL